jgi:hypothetical protein
MSVTKRADGVFTISWDEYRKTHTDFRGIWTRDDEPEHADLVGRRTLMCYDQGTCLGIEGRGLVIEGAPAAMRILRDGPIYRLERMDPEAYTWDVVGKGLTLFGAKEQAQLYRPRASLTYVQPWII